MKICDFNNEYLTPLLAKILREEKTYVLMDDFNINLINTDTGYNVSDFYDTLSSKLFAPYILQPTRLTKSSKTLTDVFLNSIEFNTFSGNLTFQISDHFPQFLILKDFYHKTLINSNQVFEQSYRFFNHDEFKNESKDVPWDNILFRDDCFLQE